MGARTMFFETTIFRIEKKREIHLEGMVEMEGNIKRAFVGMKIPQLAINFSWASLSQHFNEFRVGESCRSSLLSHGKGGKRFIVYKFFLLLLLLLCMYAFSTGNFLPILTRVARFSIIKFLGINLKIHTIYYFNGFTLIFEFCLKYFNMLNCLMKIKNH
jgi:hypothetical protein